MQSKFDNYSKLHINLLKKFNYDYNFHSTVIIDLVTIMGTIYCEDVTIPKTNNKPRLITIIIPVFNSLLWEKHKEHIEQLVNWVSSEKFIITFEKTSFKASEYKNNLLPENNHEVTLFSGGLDSLSGAFENYRKGIQSDYIGFINKDEEKTKQIEVSHFYRKVFNSATDIFLIDKPISKKETLIQSTRSLLYLSLAIAKAYFNQSNNVFLYENGILSLNPEINNRYTTKTTHPRTVFLYNTLLEKLNFDININHPFIFRTKGQIINVMDDNFKSIIKDTFTCGQGRSQLKAHKGQCGVCVPCILRKISLAAYDNEKYDVKYHYDYNVKIKDIDHDGYRKDYESNLNYFQKYYEAIKAGRIHLEIHTKEKYYKVNSNYRVSNKEMFEIFAHEYERFMKRYDPY